MDRFKNILRHKVIDLLMIIIVIALLLYQYDRVGQCICYNSLLDKILDLALIIIPLTLIYAFIKRNFIRVRENKNAFIWTIGIMIILALIGMHKQNRLEINHLKKSGGIITPARILATKGGKKTGYIDVEFYKENTKTIDVLTVGNWTKSLSKSLPIGDTILIVYSIECECWIWEYNLQPSLIEIRKFKNGVLYQIDD